MCDEGTHRQRLFACERAGYTSTARLARGRRLCVLERDSRERDECLFVARRPNYIDGGSKKKRMVVCLFFMG